MRAGKWMFLVLVLASALMAAGCAKKQITSGSTPLPRTTEGAGQETGLQSRKDQETAQKLAELRERELREEQARQAGLEEEHRHEDLARMEEEISNAVIYFDFDSFDLKPEAREKLQALADVMKENSDFRLLIEGHTDDRGTEEYNLALGERRARAAYEFLILLGVGTGRLQIISYGEEYPAVQGQNETAWARNRRDEFKILQ